MKRIYYFSLLTALLFNGVKNSSAQNAYQFYETTAAYTNLNSDTRISFAYLAANNRYLLSELNGETFRWYAIDFPLGGIKTFHVEANGDLRFDNDSSLIIVDGAFTYLDSIDADSRVSYKIEGTAGDKVVKAQWKNLRMQVGPAVNFVNLQIWVYQASGIIEIHYGPSSSNNQSGYNTTSGPQVGMFFSKDDFSKCYQKLWLNGSPAAYTLDSAKNYTFKAMAGVPVEGTVFRFVPRFATTTGMAEPHDTGSGMFVYPNPVNNGWLQLQKRSDYTVYDLQGKQLLQAKNEAELNVQLLPPGMYLLRNDQSAEVIRFVMP